MRRCESRLHVAITDRAEYGVLSIRCFVRIIITGAILVAFLSLPEALVAQQSAKPPELNPAKIAAAGIRKLAARHIDLYIDLPPAPEVDELPQIFDAAVPLWCQYFGVDPATTAEWKLIGCVMKEKDRFVAAGLYPPNLPDFPHGYARGSQLWLYNQPSSYYRRHLLLHEGTHQFMQHFLGGSGPPWYSEGMAELLGTHRWQDGKLALAIVPRSKEEVPYWGRVKVVKDACADGHPLSLLDIMHYDGRAHLKTEAYAWSWAAAYFFDQHPLTQTAFRELKAVSRRGGGGGVTERLQTQLKERWPEITEEWQLFVADCDYGYDVARAAVMRKAAIDLPPAGATETIVADRGWQSSGFRLQAGKTYRLSASGRYTIAAGPKPWPCEPGGVTIRYHQGRPLGTLLAAISDLEGDAPAYTPLAKPRAIGLSCEFKPERTGTLYLKINEAAGDLHDNGGALQATIHLLNPEP